ncbi:hypothetical protein DI09_22p50 [Mitosporidium daphniae]|uniref:Uncharacterized protein n=1 Tax=Mitosporidium daphniae TaxID=1485682 RepID=A0A098VSN5_9MICR|nr:uncharacterized protein DI09_22p50 [Mitosporidium daphniae]KGG51980.1 hypothetical protein DI09_22p50 [Mitosporidium daphniae]|eukprot:XP_013238436.1 uncharacterized protein DI09_22p50 [Mitosporidium daphniae]
MAGCRGNKIIFPFMLQENRTSNFNVFQRHNADKDAKGLNVHCGGPLSSSSAATQFPFASRLESLDSKYRYHEHKSEFDTPKITSKIRSFQRNLNGFTPISSNTKNSGSVLIGQDGDSNGFVRKHPAAFASTSNPAAFASTSNPAAFASTSNPAAFASTSNPAAFPSTSNPAAFASTSNPAAFASTSNPAAQFSFLKRPDDNQERGSYAQPPSKLDIIQGLRPQTEKREAAISEYERRIGHKINRRVALTILPLFCIVYAVSVFFDLFFATLYERKCRLRCIFLHDSAFLRHFWVESEFPKVAEVLCNHIPAVCLQKDILRHRSFPRFNTVSAAHKIPADGCGLRIVLNGVFLQLFQPNDDLCCVFRPAVFSNFKV